MSQQSQKVVQVTQVYCNETWQVDVLKNIFFIRKLYEDMAWKLVPGPFYFQQILCKTDSEEVSMLMWTNFDGFAITYLI